MSALKVKIRRLAAGAAVAGLAALQLFVPTVPAACTVAGHSLASGTVIKVDARGNAWTADSTVPGPVRELVCDSGTWVPGGSAR